MRCASRRPGKKKGKCRDDDISLLTTSTRVRPLTSWVDKKARTCNLCYEYSRCHDAKTPVQSVLSHFRTYSNRSSTFVQPRHLKLFTCKDGLDGVCVSLESAYIQVVCWPGDGDDGKKMKIRVTCDKIHSCRNF
jgi:hypothetical protein